MFNYIDKSDDDKISVKELKKYMVSCKCAQIVGQEPVHIVLFIFIRDTVYNSVKCKQFCLQFRISLKSIQYFHNCRLIR